MPTRSARRRIRNAFRIRRALWYFDVLVVDRQLLKDLPIGALHQLPERPRTSRLERSAWATVNQFDLEELIRFWQRPGPWRPLLRDLATAAEHKCWIKVLVCIAGSTYLRARVGHLRFVVHHSTRTASRSGSCVNLRIAFEAS